MSLENINFMDILSFKKQTIDYSWDKMNEIYYNNLSPRPGKVVTGRDIGEGAEKIAIYGEFFFLEVTSYFDILARHLTESQNSNDDIYFQNWIEQQYKKTEYKNDNLIIYLKQQQDDWYKDFKKIRNKIAHQTYIWSKIDNILKIDKGIIEFLQIDISENKKIGLIEYCKDIRNKLIDLIDFFEKNNYWDKRYKYNNPKKKTMIEKAPQTQCIV